MATVELQEVEPCGRVILRISYYRSGGSEATCWREVRFSFLRMLVTWWCTVCSETFVAIR
jgi:hypothetical protein